MKPVSQCASEDIVLFQYISADFEQTRFGSHCFISRAVMTSSFPWRISEVAAPQSGQ